MKRIKSRHIQIPRSKGKKFIGMKPFEGYKQLADEELKELKRLTMREAIIQTEILLRATKKMK
ncbi:MAG: hypothetical protein HY800_05240 [Ignavibacteriales bacterium]|nr:hypothetical protein [Ignavibacteriales bacterium]